MLDYKQKYRVETSVEQMQNENIGSTNVQYFAARILK